MGRFEFKQVVVLGAGFAGLLAARAVAPFASDVYVLEKDGDWDLRARKGIPQRYQCHTLLMRGQRILEDFFPGILNELAENGARPLDFSLDTCWFFRGQKMPQVPSSLIGYYATRVLWDRLVRQRLETFKNIHFIRNVSVKGLVSLSSDQEFVSLMTEPCAGRVLPKNSKEVLIIDALGARSQCAQWLSEIGVPAPPVVTQRIQIGYCTQIFQPASGLKVSWKALLAFPAHSTRGAVILPIENGNWLVTLISRGGDLPPKDPESFIEYLNSIDCPELQSALMHAVPMTSTFPYRIPVGLWRRYDQSEVPRNLLSLGDSVCRLNPTFGQGMTVVTQQAKILHELLRAKKSRDGLEALTTDYHQLISKVIRNAWELSSEEEEFQSDVRRSAFSNFFQKGAISLRNEAVATDDSTFVFFLEVCHLMRPFRALLSPLFLLRCTFVLARRLCFGRFARLGERSVDAKIPLRRLSTPRVTKGRAIGD